MNERREASARPDGVTLIAIYHFILAGILLLGAGSIIVFAILPVLFNVRDATGLVVSLAALGLGFVVAAIMGVAAAVVGFGLLGMRNWARWVAIVLAILMLPAFPIGTVIGILVIWYLLKDDVRALFERT